MKEKRRSMLRTLAFACALLGACVLTAAALGRATAREVAATWSDAVRPQPSRGGQSLTLDVMRSDPAALARARAEFARLSQQAQQEFRARMPKPHLPEDQRQPWIAAWNSMRACAASHGFEGVSEVASTYGDGKTAMPNVDLDQPNAQAALAACPFDPTSNYQREK